MPTPVEHAEAEARELVERIGASPSQLPWFGVAHDDLRPHVLEDDDGALVYLERDRGVIERRDVATNLDELLFWVFEPITERLARSWSRQQRTDRDTYAFSAVARQVALFEALDPAWAARFRAENARSIAAAGG